MGIKIKENQKQFLYNGTDWDEHRNNREFTIFSSAARTAATTNSDDIINYNARGIMFFLNIATVTGTSPTLDIAVHVKNPTTGAYTAFSGSAAVAFAQKTAAGSDDLIIYGGINNAVTGTNRRYFLALPRTIRVVATIGGTDTPTFTFSVGACMLI